MNMTLSRNVAPSPTTPKLECYTTLAALGAVTKRVRLMTNVTPIGFRNPALLAKMTSTLDLISEGRLIVGLGTGWLRQEFDVTLPRFDLMAQLDKAPGGMTLGELSQRMMVSNGNVTGIVDRLVSDGLVARAQRNGDRRTSFITLTRRGRAAFAAMATAHEHWIDELLGGVSARDAEQLSAKLKSFRSEWEGEA